MFYLFISYLGVGGGGYLLKMVRNANDFLNRAPFSLLASGLFSGEYLAGRNHLVFCVLFFYVAVIIVLSLL